MRIAHLTWSMGIGGIQTMLAGIASIQAQMGHDVAIFILDNRIDDTIMSKLDPKVKVYRFGRMKGTMAILPFAKLNVSIWRFHPDIIHSHAGKISNTIISRAPRVATFHSMNLPLEGYRNHNKYFAISEAVKEDVQSRGIENVVVIDNGIPCAEIKCKEDFSRGETIHIIQVSRIFFQQKRQDLAVRALCVLKNRLSDCQDEMKSKKCMIHFVGDGTDMDNLREMVRKANLEEDVVLEGAKDRQWVLDHLSDYDLFLQTSDHEGFGLTVAEACAAKLPVLVSDIDGPLEIIDGGRLGMVFRHGDANDLADKLFLFMRDGYETSLVEQAYENTILHYDIVRTTQRYIEEYEKVIDKKEL